MTFPQLVLGWILFCFILMLFVGEYLYSKETKKWRHYRNIKKSSDDLLSDLYNQSKKKS
jgi:hypothetical protein